MLAQDPNTMAAFAPGGPPIFAACVGDGDGTATAAAGAPMALLAAAEIQDHLMVVSNDLDRLQRLLDDASQSLMSHFTQANGQLADGALQEARQTIGGAITALQFQDMASQLIAHTTRRLRNCADRIARDTMGDP
jgi:hypothetical protein